MRIACWINKPTDTHSSYFLMLIHDTNFCVNAPQCHLLRTFTYLRFYDFI